jgi:hypothetical protein
MPDDDTETLRNVLSDELNRAVTDKELANFIEVYNSGVMGYAENYISELVSDLDEWYDENVGYDE